MKLELRKFTKFVDKTFIEGGKEAKEPVLMVSVAAVFKNPWAGQGFVEDLKPIILDLAPKLGDILVPELIKEVGSPEKILAYGKAGTVGLNGEIEHASAFIHTLRFGNKFRDAVGGTSYLSFTNTRGPAGSKISIPMMHKTDSGLRPYYLTHEFTIHDAPFDDNSFDCIFAVEVMEHLENPFLFKKEVKRMLKEEGLLVLTVPFMFHPHADPFDYWRPTRMALQHLFDDFSEVKIKNQGNRLHVILDLVSTAYRNNIFFRLLRIVNLPLSLLGSNNKSTASSGYFVTAEK